MVASLKTKIQIDRGVKLCRDQIVANPWNPNKTSDRQQQAISESLGLYGQVIEILVRPHPEQPAMFEVIDGEHRLNELPEDEIYANVVYGLPDADAKKLTIILNETRGEADKIELAQLLAVISEDIGDETIVGLPYTDTELEELIKLAEVDWDKFDSGEDGEFGAGGSAGNNDWQTISIKVPSEAMERIRDAYNLIEQERNGLHSNQEIAWGQVLESLAADYLATPR